MSPRIASLPLIERECWRELEVAARDRDHGFRRMGLATVDGNAADLRTVLLREVQRLSQDEGVNLAGVKRIIGLERLVEQAQQRVARLEAELDAAYRRIAELESRRAWRDEKLMAFAAARRRS